MKDLQLVWMAGQGASWVGSGWLELAGWLLEQHLEPSQFFLAKRALGVDTTSSIRKYFIVRTNDIILYKKRILCMENYLVKITKFALRTVTIDCHFNI